MGAFPISYNAKKWPAVVCRTLEGLVISHIANMSKCFQKNCHDLKADGKFQRERVIF